MRAPAVVVLLAALACPPWGSAQDRRIHAQAGTRVALVIGNDAYPTLPLRNGVNDARAVSAALRELGFVVDTRANTDAVTLERAVREFVGRLSPGDIGFFFYAGHGFQIEGENYLVPVDFDAQDEPEAKKKSYSADLLRSKMEAAGTRINLIVLDACRDNPFRSSRGGSRGLAAFEGAGRGTLIALAAGPGKTASDNPAAANGLFTQHLLAALRTPGLRIQDVFERTRAKVDEASGRKQTPWLLSNLIGDFYLRGTPAPGSPPAATPGRAPEAADLALRMELTYWEAVKDSKDPAAFEAYLKEYSDGRFAALARLKLAELQRRPASPPTVAPAAPGLAGGEAQRAVDDFANAPVQSLDLVSTPRQGPDDAPICVVVFSDFLCPFCRSLAGALASFLPQSQGRVLIHFKNYPLEQACNPSVKRTVHRGACMVATAALCAHEQGRFWAYHDRIFANPPQDPTLEEVVRIATEAGLDRGALQTCMASSHAKDRLLAEVAEGTRAGVLATPTVFINGKRLQQVNYFLAALDRESRRLGLPPLPAPPQGQ